MPRLDGKGPSGEGAKTGRGLGNCDSKSNTENNNVNDEVLPKKLFGRGRQNLNGRKTGNQGR